VFCSGFQQACQCLIQGDDSTFPVGSRGTCPAGTAHSGSSALPNATVPIPCLSLPAPDAGLSSCQLAPPGVDPVELLCRAAESRCSSFSRQVTNVAQAFHAAEVEGMCGHAPNASWSAAPRPEDSVLDTIRRHFYTRAGFRPSCADVEVG
jgi:hypothetical protein